MLNVLLTNDDGIEADGLQAMRAALVALEGVNLAVVAPDGNRSAMARSITTRRPLWVAEVPFADGTVGYATDGSPADDAFAPGFGDEARYLGGGRAPRGDCLPGETVRSFTQIDREGPMPRISEFYGITIGMYWGEGPHGCPHFHTYYGEHEASLDLAGEIIAGKMPRRQLRLVQAWVELHKDELNADWELAVSEKPLNPIAPLR
jgi:hypothetical protein